MHSQRHCANQNDDADRTSGDGDELAAARSGDVRLHPVSRHRNSPVWSPGQTQRARLRLSGARNETLDGEDNGLALARGLLRGGNSRHRRNQIGVNDGEQHHQQLQWW